jgi:hypothetical protein
MTRRAEDWQIELWARGFRRRWWREASVRLVEVIRTRLSGLDRRRLTDGAKGPAMSKASSAPAADVLTCVDTTLRAVEPTKRAEGVNA